MDLGGKQKKSVVTVRGSGSLFKGATFRVQGLGMYMAIYGFCRVFGVLKGFV